MKKKTTESIGSDRRIEINVGYACNNRCRFCSEFFNSRSQISSEAAKLLSTEYLMKSIADFCNQGYDHITFLGGEPTIRKDFPALVRHAKKVGFKTAFLTTNGRMFQSRAFVDELFDAGITHVNISLHGSCAEVHDRIVQSRGAFDQIMRGIENIKNASKRFSLTSVINKLNLNDLPDLIRMSLALQPERICWAFVRPNGAAYKDFAKIVPRMSDLYTPLQASLKIGAASERAFTIANVPLCHLQGYEGYSDELYWTDDSLWRTVNKYISVKGGGPFGSGLLASALNKIGKFIDFDTVRKTDEQYLVTPGHHKVKSESCKSCKYFMVCDGVLDEYVRNCGFAEFSPIYGERLAQKKDLRIRKNGNR